MKMKTFTKKNPQILHRCVSFRKNLAACGRPWFYRNRTVGGWCRPCRACKKVPDHA